MGQWLLLLYGGVCGRPPSQLLFVFIVWLPPAQNWGGCRSRVTLKSHEFRNDWMFRLRLHCNWKWPKIRFNVICAVHTDVWLWAWTYVDSTKCKIRISYMKMFCYAMVYFAILIVCYVLPWVRYCCKIFSLQTHLFWIVFIIRIKLSLKCEPSKPGVANLLRQTNV